MIQLHRISIHVTLGLLLTGCAARDVASPALCYRLVKGPWVPAVSASGDSIIRSTPPLVLLTAFAYPQFSGWNVAIGYPLDTTGSAPITLVSSAYGTWHMVGADTVAIEWADGYEGIHVSLAVGPDTLRGTALNYSDVGPRVDPIASILAVPARCPAGKQHLR